MVLPQLSLGITISCTTSDQSHQLKDTNVDYPHSISEDLSAFKNRSSTSSDRQKNHNKIDEWDTDLDAEVLLDLELEQSRLKRGFANFKSKVKSKQQPSISFSSSNSSTNLSTSKKDTSPIRNIGPSSSFRQSFMRRRRYNKDTVTADESNNASSNISRSSITAPLTTAAVVAGATVEIATAVPVVVSGKLDSNPIQNHDSNKELEIESGVEMMEETIPPTVNILQMPNVNSVEETVQTSKDELYSKVSLDRPADTEIPSQKIVNSPNEYQFSNLSLLERLFTTIKSLPIYPIIALVVVLVIPLNDFVRGMLVCLLCIIVSQNLIKFLAAIIDNFILSYTPEKIPFKIPDYRKMPECIVPAVKDDFKYYEGWMNEIDAYDPDTFQMSHTSSVYVKLEGSILHVSSTTAHIPKRMMWNEKPIDVKSITFQTHRTYNLLGCRVELLPVGLAIKRYFSRKYPIQLIVDASKYTFTNLDENNKKKKGQLKIDKPKKADRKQVKIDKIHVTESKSKEEKDSDLGETLLKADLKNLQNDINPDIDLKNMPIPTGDEVRILLFARTARQKEDWFRHFIAARDGDIYDKETRARSVRFVDDEYLQQAAQRADRLSVHGFTDINTVSDLDEEPSTSKKGLPQNSADKNDEDEMEEDFIDLMDDVDTVDGLIMTTCAARIDPKYICFMSLYQKACNQTRIPVYKERLKKIEDGVRHRKRSVRNQQVLWKSIDQSLFLGPSGSVVWANVLAGHVLFSLLQNEIIKNKITVLIQKKINAVKLPGFIEEVTLTHINLGNKPPLVHRVSQPLINERGVWVDADITYDGFCHVTITTKLNLLRLKRPATGARPQADESSLPTETQAAEESRNIIEGTGVDVHQITPHEIIYDSDAESIGSSSSESEDIVITNAGMEKLNTSEGPTQGKARRLFKFVDKLATSHLFHYATEISYVQKAMENMNTTITLGLDIRGLVGRATINMPPPPSDRIWMGFRSPPRVWLTARPTVGDKSVDWSIVTNVIEGKLCEGISKYIVVPNMVDIVVPYIGKSATEL